MLKWQGRTPFEQLDLPRRCFISHSYQDAAERTRLLELLPRYVEAVVFPPITAHPDQFVSSKLVEAIVGCEGLIYIDGSASARSFWVSFERDFALRASRQVYAFDPTTESLVR